MATNNATGNDAMAQYATYEDYLDAQITEKDMYYLEDEELARQLVELGYRGQGETLNREEFLHRKREILEMSQPQIRRSRTTLESKGKDLSDSPLLQALADREDNVRNGKQTVSNAIDSGG